MTKHWDFIDQALEEAFTVAKRELTPEKAAACRQVIEAAIADQWSFHDLVKTLGQVFETAAPASIPAAGGP